METTITFKTTANITYTGKFCGESAMQKCRHCSNNICHLFNYRLNNDGAYMENRWYRVLLCLAATGDTVEKLDAGPDPILTIYERLQLEAKL